MKNLTILFLVLPILFLSSCLPSNVRFLTPQPESLKILEIIPEKFQGTFVINKDTVVVTDYTVAGDRINSDSLIVKGWGNYLFVNQLDVVKGSDTVFFRLMCAKVVSVWNNEEISLQYFNIDLEEPLKEFILNTDTAGLVDAEIEPLFLQYLINNQSAINDNIVGVTQDGDFILDNINLNEFQTLLNRSAKNTTTKVVRVK